MAGENLNQVEIMKELIGIAVVVATLFGGTMTAGKIFMNVREFALIKSAHGLPKLAPFARNLTNESKP